MESYTVPEVIDYILQAGETAQLDHDINEWKRKVQIAEGENKSLRSQWKRLRT